MVFDYIHQQNSASLLLLDNINKLLYMKLYFVR